MVDEKLEATIEGISISVVYLLLQIVIWYEFARLTNEEEKVRLSVFYLLQKA